MWVRESRALKREREKIQCRQSNTSRFWRLYVYLCKKRSTTLQCCGLKLIKRKHCCRGQPSLLLLYLWVCHNCRYHNSRVSAAECCCINIHFELEICVYSDTNLHLLNQFYICGCKNDAGTVLQQQNQLYSNLRLLLSTVFVATNICSCSC